MLNKSILSLLLITLSFMSFKGVAADFITPASVTSLHTNSSSAYNNVNALIENAVDISYIAPNPSGGGSRTSTWVSESANTWTFNLDSAYTLNEIHVWDYYGHSPTGWELTFFDGDNASGTNLGSHTFSIAPVCVLHCSKLNTISFADVSNVKSVTLRSTNASARGGVGLAEVHFGGVITAPPPVARADWHFDEISWSALDDEIVDASGNNFHSKSGFSTNTVAGKLCQAADLSANGTSDYLIMDDTSLNSLSDFSFSVWINTSKTTGQQEILQALGSSRNDDEFELALEGNDSIFIKIKDDSEDFSLSNNELTNGDWNHLVVTRSGNTACLYINGSLKDCKNTYPTGALSITSGAMLMGQEQDSFGGGFSGSQDFEGLIDEPLIFNRVLALSEVQDGFNNQNTGNNWDGSVRTCPIPPPTVCGNGTLNAVGIKISSGGGSTNSQINTTTEALSIHAAWLAAGSPATGLIDSTYNVTASGSDNVDRIDFGGSDRDFAGTLPYPGVGAGVTGSDFLVHASGTIGLPAGDYTIYVDSDDGFSFVMNTLSGDTVSFNKFGSSTGNNGNNELRFESPTGSSNTGGSFTLTQDSVFEVAGIFFERGGGDFFEVAISNDIRSSTNSSGYEVLKDGALGGKVSLGQCVTISASVDDVSVLAGTTADFTVSLNVPAPTDTVISYSTSDDTALAGDDYTADTGSITIPAGQTTGTISIDTLDDNKTGDVQFQLNITSSNVDIADATGVGTISSSSCSAVTGTLNAIGIKIGGGGSNPQINTTSEALTIHAAWLAAGSPASGLIDGGTYNVAASGSNTVDRIDFGGSAHDFTGTLPYPGSADGVSGEDFLVHVSGTLNLPAGDYTIYVESDDGFSFVMNTLSGDTVAFNKFGSPSSSGSNELRFENPTGNSNTGGSFTLNQDSRFDIAGVFFERGGGDYFEVSIANDIRSSSAPSGYEILRNDALGGKVKFGQCESVAECSASLPDALSSHNGGLLSLGSGIGISGPDNLLPFGVVSPTANNACTGLDCIADTSASAALLDPGAFPNTSGFANNLNIPNNGSETLGDSGINEYDQVSVGNNGTLNISSAFNEYFIDRLTVGGNGIINLQPGTYWVGSYTAGNNTKIKVLGSGTARLIINNSVEFNQNMWANNSNAAGTAGDTSKLFLFGYNNITFNQNTRLWGGVYAKNDIAIGGGSLYEGALTGSDVSVGNNTTVTYDTAILSIDFGGLCSGSGTCTLGSFAITQPAYGLACPNSKAGINIKAMCADGTTVKTDYAGTIDLSSNENTQSDFFFGGSVVNNVVLNGSENGEVNVDLFHKNEKTPLKVTAMDTAEGVSSEAVNGTDFRTSGFAVSAPNNFTCGGSSSMTLTAIGDDDTGASCSQLTGFTGNKNLKIWSDINIDQTESPGVKDGGLAVDMLVDGQPITGNEPASNNITLQFTAGVSTFPVNYLDVGEVLDINVIHDDAPYDNNTPPFSPLLASSGRFIVSPERIEVSADDTLAAACAAPLASCTKLAKANASFAITGRAVCDDASNTVAQSYRGKVGLTHQVVAPATGVAGLLAEPELIFDGTGTLAGEANQANQKISEVGVFTISTLSTSYFGQTVLPSTSSNIGRFYPDQFEVTITDSTFQPMCSFSNPFTYMDEPFLFLTPPEVTVTAVNVDGAKTQNYEGDFWKLGPNLDEDSSCSGTGTIKGFCYTDNVGVAATMSAPSVNQTYGDTSNIDGEVTLTFHNTITDEFVYRRPLASPPGGLVAPFDADVKLTIELSDADTVTGSGTLANIGFSGDIDAGGVDLNLTNNKYLRYGRLKLDNTFGPETSALKVPLFTQYYDGTTFITNTDDSCSTYDAANMEVNPNLENSGSTSALVSGVVTVAAGEAILAQQIVLSAPGLTHEGNADLCLNTDNWLKFDWNGNGLDVAAVCDTSSSPAQGDNPMSTATFGRYRGHDRIIYWREVSN